MDARTEHGRRRDAWAAWALVVACGLLVLAAVVDTVVRGRTVSGLLVGVTSAAFAVTGALVVSRRRERVIGWLLLAIAASAAVTTAAEVYVEVAGRPGREWVGWVAAWMWMVWTALVGIFLPLLFPTGRPPSRRWRPLLWFAGGGLVLQVVANALHPGRLESISTPIDNPVGLGGPAGEAVGVALDVATIVWAASVLAAVVSFVVRFRRARGTERLQLTWVAYASVAAVLGVVLLVAGEWVPAPLGGEQVGGVGYLLIAFGLWFAMPAAVAVAVLRHRLFDIDVVVNRTLVYGSLSVTLLAAYVGSVLVLQVLLDPITGGSDLAVAVSTLVVAGLFRPLRSRVQRLVDRRFYRRRYDGQRTVRAFAVRLRSELDLAAVGEDLRAVVADTVQPTHVRLWLRGAP